MPPMRNRRGENGRTPTVSEIKRSICTHERLASVGPSEQRSAGADWHTKMTCPTCGAWYIRATADGAVLAPVAPVNETAQAPAVVSS